MPRKNKVWGIILIILGAWILVGGASMLATGDVDCGGQTMTSSDTCVTYDPDDDETTERSLEQQRNYNWVMIAATMLLGVVLAAWGIRLLMKAAKQKRAMQAGFQPPPPGSYSQQPGQYPPPGAHPQHPGFPSQHAAPQQWQPQQPPQQGGYPPHGRP